MLWTWWRHRTLQKKFIALLERHEIHYFLQKCDMSDIECLHARYDIYPLHYQELKNRIFELEEYPSSWHYDDADFHVIQKVTCRRYFNHSSQHLSYPLLLSCLGLDKVNFTESEFRVSFQLQLEHPWRRGSTFFHKNHDSIVWWFDETIHYILRTESKTSTSFDRSLTYILQELTNIKNYAMYDNNIDYIYYLLSYKKWILNDKTLLSHISVSLLTYDDFIGYTNDHMHEYDLC